MSYSKFERKRSFAQPRNRRKEIIRIVVSYIQWFWSNRPD